jgi:mono/diheme cytochrome c family protein
VLEKRKNKMKKKHYILGVLVLVFIIIQFIPTELPPVEKENAGDIIKSGLASQDVVQLFKTSCYSCHSNETEYPWYSYVAPSSWLVARDVREGRKELNFSTWQDYELRRMVRKLDDISSEVGEGHMPMPIYTLMHPSAKLSDEQRELIVAWTETAMDSLMDEEDDDEEEE